MVGKGTSPIKENSCFSKKEEEKRKGDGHKQRSMTATGCRRETPGGEQQGGGKSAFIGERSKFLR